MVVDQYLPDSLQHVTLRQVLPQHVWHGRWVLPQQTTNTSADDPDELNEASVREEPPDDDAERREDWEKEVYQRDATREGLANSCLGFFVRRCRRVTKLSAGGIPILDRALAEAAQRWPQLQRLDLYESPVITDAAVKAVAEACPALRFVQLTGCTEVRVRRLITLSSLCRGEDDGRSRASTRRSKLVVRYAELLEARFFPVFRWATTASARCSRAALRCKCCASRGCAACAR